MGIGIKELQEIFQLLQKQFSFKKDFLTGLDSVLGDGDLGLTMGKAFDAAAENSAVFEGSDIGEFLIRNGMVMAKAAPSTMGSLLAAGFMAAGKNLRGREAMDLDDWGLFFGGLQVGIAKLGKASLGEKTILDILEPVSIFVQKNKYENENILFSELLPFARKCLENTVEMEAQHGKAACYGKKSIGHVDAGASAALLLLETIGNYFGIIKRS